MNWWKDAASRRIGCALLAVLAGTAFAGCSLDRASLGYFKPTQDLARANSQVAAMRSGSQNATDSARTSALPPPLEFRPAPVPNPPIELVAEMRPLPETPAVPPPVQVQSASIIESRQPAALKPRTVDRANAATFEDRVLKSEEPVLVDFYANWCGPCKRLAPVLEELACETPSAKIVKVDVDENAELAARYGVKSLPSLIVFKNGKAVAKQNGAVEKERLMALLDL
jgi:thioredoxin 1